MQHRERASRPRVVMPHHHPSQQPMHVHHCIPKVDSPITADPRRAPRGRQNKKPFRKLRLEVVLGYGEFRVVQAQGSRARTSTLKGVLCAQLRHRLAAMIGVAGDSRVFATVAVAAGLRCLWLVLCQGIDVLRRFLFLFFVLCFW